LKSSLLLSPLFLVSHFGLLVFFLGYTLKFGPYEQPKPELAVRSRNLTSMSESKNTGSSHSSIKPELLLAEKRPGALNINTLYLRDGKLFGDMHNGWQAALTLDNQLQADTAKVFLQGRPALATMAVVEVDTGKIIGLSEYIDPDHEVTKFLQIQHDTHLALKSLAPGANMIKLMTTSALLDMGISDQEDFCYPSLTGRIQDAKQVAKSLAKETNDKCSNLFKAFTEGQNDFYLTLINEKLGMDDIKKKSTQIGFNKPFDYFELQHEPSSLYIPTNDVARAQTAIGFRNSRVSTLHSALIMAAIASKDGKIKRPQLIEALIREDSYTVDSPKFNANQTYGFDQKSLPVLRNMLQSSMKNSNVQKVFVDWPSELKPIQIAGQIGTIRRLNPYISYTWFNGYFPIDKPKYAISILVINNEHWYLQAVHAAHRILKTYLSRKNVLERFNK
jgi:cell division protein FtsI/penicillin-binding protein 2